MSGKSKAKRNQKSCTCARNEEHPRVRIETRKLDGKLVFYGAWDDPEVERTEVIGAQADGTQPLLDDECWYEFAWSPHMREQPCRRTGASVVPGGAALGASLGWHTR